MAKVLTRAIGAVAILGNGKWAKSMERDPLRDKMVANIQVAGKTINIMEKELTGFGTVIHMRDSSEMENMMALELLPMNVEVCWKACSSKVIFMIRMDSLLNKMVQRRELITNMATLLSIMNEQKQTEGLHDFIF